MCYLTYEVRLFHACDALRTRISYIVMGNGLLFREIVKNVFRALPDTAVFNWYVNITLKFWWIVILFVMQLLTLY